MSESLVGLDLAQAIRILRIHLAGWAPRSQDMDGNWRRPSHFLQ